MNRLDTGAIKTVAVNSAGEAICIADLLVAPASPRAAQRPLPATYPVQETSTSTMVSEAESFARFLRCEGTAACYWIWRRTFNDVYKTN